METPLRQSVPYAVAGAMSFRNLNCWSLSRNFKRLPDSSIMVMEGSWVLRWQSKSGIVGKKSMRNEKSWERNWSRSCFYTNFKEPPVLIY